MKEIEVHTFNDIPYNFTGIVKFKSGTKRWYKNGKFHRLDGPAIDCTDRKEYWIDKIQFSEYWINDIRYSKEEFDKKTYLIQQQISKRYTDYKHLTDEQWYDYLNIWVV